MVTASPVFVAGRCVHEHLETARCVECVRACPRGVLKMTDAELRIDTTACDGCGLCIPACPQEAIGMDRLPGAPDGSAVAETCVQLVCDRACAPDRPATVPCVHAVGWQAIVRLRGRGTRSFHTSRGDCSRCARRPSGEGFDAALARVNAMLEGRGLSPLTAHEGTVGRAPPAKSVGTLPDGRRRAFLRRLAHAPSAQRTVVGLESAAALLPEGGVAPIYPCVPVIDPDRCQGCDACARLCPAKAIAVHAETGQVSYLLRASRCTGCAICVDVCDSEAISIRRWVPQTQHAVPLVAAQCPRCGVTHHAPGLDPGGRCAVCAAPGGRGRLFIVDEADPAPDQSASAA